MADGSIASKDIISWGVGLVPLLIFYLEYRIYKKQSNKKISNLEEMLYKELLARKDLEIKELKKENEELKKKLEEETKKKKKLGRN